MSVFKRNADGDLDRGENNRGFSRVSGQEEARVRLETVLRLAQGEVKRDTRAGLDQEYLFDPLVPAKQKANHTAATMMSVPGVTDAQVGMNFTAETGVLALDALTTYSESDQNDRTVQMENFLVFTGSDVGGSTK
jgi:hypothetical protein